jgi:hypothetical protein
MQMNSLRKLVLLFMLGWLPLSGAIAAVMPISGMPGGSARSFSAPASDDVQAADASASMIVSSMPCHNSDSSAPSSDSALSGTCTHCVLCHLAVSLIPPTIPTLQAFKPSHRFTSAPLLSHASFIPELASPPPRTLAS